MSHIKYLRSFNFVSGVIMIPAKGGDNPDAMDFTEGMVTAWPALKLSNIVGAEAR